MMKLLDSLTMHRPGDAPRKVELYRGDLTALEPGEAVDVLVVSAFRGDYRPTASSLIGAFHHKGHISVAELAEDKAVDLREYFSCWLSQDLTRSHPGCGFKRLLCFEPANDAGEAVEHLFQALAPFLGGKMRLSTVAMPLIAAGARGATVRDILTRLIDEAVNWMSLGFPLRRLKVVEYERTPPPGQAAPVFADAKKKHSRWDVFISYSHEESEVAGTLYRELTGQGLQIFRDSHSLPTGSTWRDEILNSIKSSSYFVPLYSSDYLRSDMCMYEFSIAMASNKPILFPICLCSVVELPAFMIQDQLELCPKGDSGRLREACQRLITRLQG
ncbi:MAG TPA: toll/interleukin-1 receptor domain-containing protein [Gemmataceae bacterium]|nr:toll/interleukin-1 receptor domain-containing protein [Gemmataceae bacterium]